MSGADTVLRVEDLTIRNRLGAALVADVSFELPMRGIVTIIGESGGGKSLIAQAIMGLLPSGFMAMGNIWLNDRCFDAADTSGIQARWSMDTLFLPQEPRAALDPTMPLQRQLFLGAHQRDQAAVVSALNAVDMPTDAVDRYAFQLSGGMAQRGLVAASLLSDAPILIADEPTKGLDADRVTGVAQLLLGVRDSGRSLLVVTHDLALVTALGGHLVVLEGGRIREQGETNQVFDQPTADYTRSWLTANPSAWAPCKTCDDAGDVVLAAHDLAAEHAGGRRLFEGVDIHLSPGQSIGITGPSGCGKSTLGNVLLGLKPPSAGQVTWGTVDPYRDTGGRTHLRRRYQKLNQDPAAMFIPHRRLGQQLRDVVVLSRQPEGDNRFEADLERLKLKPELLSRYPSEISGGEAQRLALLRLLLLEPEVIVADEPTSRLDPIVQKQTISLLRDLVETRRIALVLIAHDRALLAASTDKVIDLGRSRPSLTCDA